MLKHVVYASATASLLITMAGPAMASTNSEETTGRQRTNIQRDFGARGGYQGQRGSRQRGARQWKLGESRDTACVQAERAQEKEQLKEAAKTLQTALKEARTAREAAYAQAKTLTDVTAAKAARQAANKDYRTARSDAQQAFSAARRTVHAVLVASETAACPALQ
jgi:hypothetical protein